ncbi:acetaldehyde dehydrogenase [Streptomyces pluripotens]|uniref:Acetaldehyde dehydrogenase n=1 Tax=Streptomyces pluripotens TaxID=1355015 RepID=A0A221NTK6_9ACTN|nr:MULTISPECIES: acetaldehyde dehydrogenase [Streptomyces]ARP69049.1 acetaldehyde dehydrogenase [Streptomyces pluripotens]ASN23309.1 acetaldehyde dehydrogenase [Streptomyces pluripotens]MCH0558956.1 acetaldehyde dehydrogenase [Streptomyces sp. MUM 16J]
MTYNDSRAAAGRLSVAVLGTGLIGIDLVTKIIRSGRLDLRLVAGRNEAAPALRRTAALGVPVSAGGVESLVDVEHPFDVVFDATSAASHARHREKLSPLGTTLIDLTPSRSGRMIIPTVNRADIPGHRDLSMVSCGGQASVPVLHAITRAHRIDYIEVVTTCATLSIGHGTRMNLDEYVETTQEAIRYFTGVRDVKVMLNISPARPPATFRVAMSLLGPDLTTESVSPLVAAAADDVRSYAGGFEVKACTVNDGKAFVSVEVTSSGDRIPRYAGNLDIINSAAILVAESYAAERLSMAGVGKS